MSEQVYLTKDGAEDLRLELHELINVKRPELANKLQEAIALGDLSENADYIDAKEQQVVQLVVSLFNGCNYCSSMHSKFSEVNGVSHEDVLAIRNGEKPKDQHIADLVWTTNTILEKRGHLSEADLEKIEKMGIDSARLYEILAHIGRKMIANYAVHIINPELDEVFKFEE